VSAPLVHEPPPRPGELPQEPPPPLGSWTRFYLLVALIHVVVVGLLIAFTATFNVRGPR
jgi:hypothetical protein